MMSSLKQAIKNALDTAGSTKEANKAYLEFIKGNFIVPIEKNLENSEPRVLFLLQEENRYLPVFTDREYLDDWAKEIAQEIDLLSLSGVDLLKGIGDGVTVCLNISSNIYKEFNPAEIARMRSMVLKLFKD